MGTARSDHSDRDKATRIARLKQRLDSAKDAPNRVLALADILRGILDLLADEL